MEQGRTPHKNCNMTFLTEMAADRSLSASTSPRTRCMVRWNPSSVSSICPSFSLTPSTGALSCRITDSLSLSER